MQALACQGEVEGQKTRHPAPQGCPQAIHDRADAMKIGLNLSYLLGFFAFLTGALAAGFAASLASTAALGGFFTAFALLTLGMTFFLI